MRRRQLTQLAATAALLMQGACIPYTVGSTAETVAPGEHTVAMSLSVIPVGALPLDTGSRELRYMTTDFEGRVGVDERSDVGLRVTSASGIVVNYKRKLFYDPEGDGMAVAVMAGGGFVNLGQHAEVELSLLASSPNHNNFVGYGGLRVVQVIPLSSVAVHDSPTAGGFLGLRIGSTDLGVSPEVAVYYDHSALNLRKGDLLIVPALTIHGSRLLEVYSVLGRH
jgi:hypothetical protein